MSLAADGSSLLLNRRLPERTGSNRLRYGQVSQSGSSRASTDFLSKKRRKLPISKAVNLYEQYAESNVMTASPMELVRMLYRFIIENLGEASHCTMTGDIEGRGRAVSKATEGFLEFSQAWIISRAAK